MTNYFTSETDKDIQEFLSAKNDLERNKIYEEKLHAPFTTLVECIYRKYKFALVEAEYGDKVAIELGLSKIMDVLPKIDSAKGKAFAYISTAVKYYYIHQNIQLNKHQQKFVDMYQPLSDKSSGTTELTLSDVLPELSVDKTRDFDTKDFTNYLMTYLTVRRSDICRLNDRTITNRHSRILDAIISLLNDCDIDFVDGRLKHITYAKIRELSGTQGSRSMSNFVLRKLGKIYVEARDSYLNDRENREKTHTG